MYYTSGMFERDDQFQVMMMEVMIVIIVEKELELEGK